MRLQGFKGFAEAGQRDGQAGYSSSLRLIGWTCCWLACGDWLYHASMPDPALLMPMLLAPTLGVMIFGGFVVIGVRIVRWMRLPIDLPEIPRYEPPAPIVRETADPTAARAVAAQRVALAEKLSLAHATVRDVFAGQELILAMTNHPQATEPAHAATIATARAAFTALQAAGEAADGIAQRLRAAPDEVSPAAELAGLRERSQTARQQIEAAAATLPDVERRRRLWLMIIAVAVLMTWAYLMLALLKRG
jgi:hypothetical protein